MNTRLSTLAALVHVCALSLGTDPALAQNRKIDILKFAEANSKFSKERYYMML